MSLRDALKRTLATELHGCTPYALQQCNSGQKPATGDATPVQLRPVPPMTGRATPDATPMQPGSCTTALRRRVDATAVRSSCTVALPRVRNCATCRHLTTRKTCAEPVAAGLTEQFSLVWPDMAAGNCPAWRRRSAEAITAVAISAAREGWPADKRAAWMRDADEHPDAVIDALGGNP